MLNREVLDVNSCYGIERHKGGLVFYVSDLKDEDKIMSLYMRGVSFEFKQSGNKYSKFIVLGVEIVFHEVKNAIRGQQLALKTKLRELPI